MSMARLSWIAEVTGGRLQGGDSGFDSVSTDTRSLEAGQLFFALRGPRHDAASFVALAGERGAAGAVVEQGQPAALPQVVVADSGEALRDAATVWRRRFTGPVLGVTGSNGKTTVKEMLGAVMRAHVNRPRNEEWDDGDVLVTWGNLNNHIGVPVTLLWLRERHRVAVIEMGASAGGEIAVLTGIAQPTVAIITNAGPAHLAGFGGTVAQVARAKGEMFQGLAPGATAVVNRDDPFHAYWRGLRADVAWRSFGRHPEADFRAENVQAANGTGLRFRLSTPIGATDIDLPMAGTHNVENALAAAAATMAAGATLDAVRRGLQAMANVGGRLKAEPGPAGSVIYDDSYNANPGSVGAALRFLAGLDGERWFVLGDMGELGADEVDLHRRVGALAASLKLDRFYCVGRLARHAAEGYGSDAVWYADIDAATRAIGPDLHAGTRLLVKGSRSAGLDRLVRSLTGREPVAGGTH